MSRFLHKLLTASALAAGSFAIDPLTLFADDAAKGEGDKPKAEAKREGGDAKAEAPRPEVADLFKKLDADGDGKIAEDDVPEEHRRLFNRLVGEGDKDKDGKLSLDEFRAGLMADRSRAEAGQAEGGPRGMGRPADPAEAFKRMDRNGDGKLTADDVPEEARERFKGMAERLDTNKDGSVSEEEFRKSMGPREGAQAGAGPRDGGPREGGPRDGAPGQGGPFQGGPRGGMGMGFVGSPIVQAVDANHDGELSADEIAAASTVLKKLDKDGDGKLSRQELMPKFEPGRTGQPGGFGRPEGRGDGQPGGGLFAGGEFFKSRDTNGDGKISREEAPERMKEHFDRIDKNSDGSIDETELRQVFAGANRPDGAGRPEGGPRDGRRPEGDRGPEGNSQRRPEGQPRGDAGPERREGIVRDGADRFKAADKDGDGKLSKDEVPENVREHFGKIDTNGDGSISPDEMREAGRTLSRRDGDRPADKKPEGERRRDGDKKPEGEKKADGDKDGKREEAKKDEPKKDDAPSK